MVVWQDTSSRQQRRGILLTLELLLILPLLMLVLSAVLQCVLLVAAKTRMNNAAAAVAHQITYTNSNAERIQAFLRKSLGTKLATGSLAEVTLPSSSEEIGQLRLLVPASNAVPKLPGYRIIVGPDAWIQVTVPIVIHEERRTLSTR